MEAEAAGDAEAAARAPAVARAERAGRVLEQRHVGQLVQRAAAGRRGARASSAFVRGPTSIFAGSMFIVSGSTSTSTGRRPASATTFAVAGKVYAGTSTSSPGSSPNASTARCSAAVPELTASACSTSQARASSGLELVHLRAHREHPALEDLRAPRRARARRCRASLGGRECFRPVPRDRLLEAFVELHAAAPSRARSRAFSTFGMRSSTSA